MYVAKVTLLSSFAAPNGTPVPLPATRGSRIQGIRFVAIPSGGQSLSDAYAGLTLYTQQTTNNPNAGNINPPVAAAPVDQIPIVDDSMLNLCSPQTLALKGNTGQLIYCYIAEGEAEDIYPGGYGVISQGSGGNPSGGVTTTTQATATGYTPTLGTDGANTTSAKGERIYLSTGGTFVDGMPLLAWRYLADAIWVRCPANDQSVPAGSAELGPGATIGLPDFSFSVGAAERYALIAAASAISGAATVTTTYETQT